MQTQTILDRINTLPRIKLARLNTPFEEMPRLRAAIADSMDADPNANKCAVPQLFIKRDDTTGFAFGGNKARHMEFLFAHLIDRGIDTIVNINHYDSNNARLVSAACAKTGMKCHWVAFDMLDKPITGNLLLGHLAGAVIHRVPAEHSRSVAENLLAEETKNGRNATILSDNPFFDIAGMIGFLETGAELDTQIANVIPAKAGTHSEGDAGAQTTDNRQQGMPGPTDAQIANSPSPARGGGFRWGPDTPANANAIPAKAGTQSGGPTDAQIANFPSPARGGGFRWGPNTPLRMWGLCGRSIAGIRLYARNTAKPWAASATAQEHHAPDTYQATYIERSTRVANLLNLDTALVPGDIDTITGYAGRYGVPTEAAIEAIHMVAKTEGIILDPNYTAKSMSALIGEIRARNLDPEIPIIFIHSGGQPQTFAFAQELWDWEG